MTLWVENDRFRWNSFEDEEGRGWRGGLDRNHRIRLNDEVAYLLGVRLVRGPFPVSGQLGIHYLAEWEPDEHGLPRRRLAFPARVPVDPLADTYYGLELYFSRPVKIEGVVLSGEPPLVPLANVLPLEVHDVGNGLAYVSFFSSRLIEEPLRSGSLYLNVVAKDAQGRPIDVEPASVAGPPDMGNDPAWETGEEETHWIEVLDVREIEPFAPYGLFTVDDAVTVAEGLAGLEYSAWRTQEASDYSYGAGWPKRSFHLYREPKDLFSERLSSSWQQGAVDWIAPGVPLEPLRESVEYQSAHLALGWEPWGTVPKARGTDLPWAQVRIEFSRFPVLPETLMRYIELGKEAGMTEAGDLAPGFDGAFRTEKRVVEGVEEMDVFAVNGNWLLQAGGRRDPGYATALEDLVRGVLERVAPRLEAGGRFDAGFPDEVEYDPQSLLVDIAELRTVKRYLAANRTTMSREQIESGGTCVNVGCVPSKILAQGATLARLRTHPPIDGLGECRPTVDRGRMLAQQRRRVQELRQSKYRRILDDSPRISLLEGRAWFEDAATMVVETQEGSHRHVRADRFLIATGAAPAAPPIPGLDGTPFWTSEDALAAAEVPGHLVVVGGSAVGLEIGQAYLHLGARVTLIEKFSLLPNEDPAIGEALRTILTGEDARVMTNADIERVSHDGRTFSVQVHGMSIAADRMLVATGRAPNTAGLGLDSAGVEMEHNGAIRVDDHMRTSAPGIYAAGDCTNQPQLVYVAAAAGTRAAVNMTGGDAAIDLSVVPAVVFTEPQAAFVGLGEEAARARGITVRARTLALEDVPRALVNFDTRGFVKLVAEDETGRLVGAAAVAPAAGEIIQTAAIAIAQGMTFTDLADRLFPYLTMSEGLKLCAQTFTRDVKALSCCAG